MITGRVNKVNRSNPADFVVPLQNGRPQILKSTTSTIRARDDPRPPPPPMRLMQLKVIYNDQVENDLRFNPAVTPAAPWSGATERRTVSNCRANQLL